MTYNNFIVFFLYENGDDSGTQVCYDGMNNKPKEPCRLMMLTEDGNELSELDVYAKSDDVDAIFIKIEKQHKNSFES